MAYDGSGEDDERWESEERGVLGHERVATWAEETRRYRSTPAGWWWLALLAIPALLAALSLAVGGGSDDPKATPGTSSTTRPATSSSSDSASGTSTSSSSTSAQPSGDGSVASSAFAVTRAGDAVTVKADVADAAAKTALLDALKSALGVSAVTDKVTVAAGAKGPSAEAVGAAVSALKDAGDFGLAWDLKSVVATGSVASEDAKKAVSDALAAAWPGAATSNGVSIGTDSAATCTNLGQMIQVALADTKITFVKYGTDPDAASVTVLKKVAGMAAKCPDARLTVTGYTDSSGSDAENKVLSEQRAKAVQKVLVSNGVAAGQVAAVGKGEADPIASNTTASGIAANRRVEITVN